MLKVFYELKPVVHAFKQSLFEILPSALLTSIETQIYFNETLQIKSTFHFTFSASKWS